jgi:hypothetical protein
VRQQAMPKATNKAMASPEPADKADDPKASDKK